MNQNQGPITREDAAPLDDVQDRARLAFAELQLLQERGQLNLLTQGQALLHNSIDPLAEVPALHGYCATKIQVRGWALNE